MKNILAIAILFSFVIGTTGCTSAKSPTKTKIGHTILLDFEGFLDGKAFAGGKGDDYELKLGSGKFIPGFEDQLVGYAPGDKVEVKVTFPAIYNVKHLANKEVIFKCKIEKITK